MKKILYTLLTLLSLSLSPCITAGGVMSLLRGIMDDEIAIDDTTSSEEEVEEEEIKWAESILTNLKTTNGLGFIALFHIGLIVPLITRQIKNYYLANQIANQFIMIAPKFDSKVIFELKDEQTPEGTKRTLIYGMKPLTAIPSDDEHLLYAEWIIEKKQEIGCDL